MNTQLATPIIESLGCNPSKIVIKRAITLYLSNCFEEVMGRLIDNKQSQDYLNQVQELFDEIMGDLEEI